MELGKIIEDNSEDDNTNNSNNQTNKNGEALSKGGILEKVIALFQYEITLREIFGLSFVTS